MSLVINGKRISIEAEKSVIAVLRREIENMTLWARYVRGSKDLEEEAARLREVIEAVVGGEK